MTTPHQPRIRFGATFLLLIFTITPNSRAQDSAASARAASVNLSSGDAVQTSPQQPGADVSPQAGAKQLTNYVEAGGDYLTLTNGFGHWAGGYARGVVTQRNNIWNAEVNRQYEFGDAGVYLGAGDSYNFDPDWYGSLTVGTSVGGFFWPRFRGDGFINKKWMARKQLITTFGFGY
jgi:hypothetical protein